MTSVFEYFPLRLILASTSPRRRELLGHLGLPFEVFAPQTEELRKEGEDPVLYCKRNALEKAQDVFQSLKDPKAIVIGSDTIGVFESHVLEKPKDSEDAKRMLRQLSGKTHVVATGVAVVTAQSVQNFAVETAVDFKQLTAKEIDYYVATKEPLDKAGSYALQGIGAFLVRAIRGSHSCVVGLPLVELSEALERCLPKP